MAFETSFVSQLAIRLYQISCLMNFLGITIRPHFMVWEFLLLLVTLSPMTSQVLVPIIFGQPTLLSVLDHPGASAAGCCFLSWLNSCAPKERRWSYRGPQDPTRTTHQVALTCALFHLVPLLLLLWGFVFSAGDLSHSPWTKDSSELPQLLPLLAKSSSAWLPSFLPPPESAWCCIGLLLNGINISFKNYVLD